MKKSQDSLTNIVILFASVLIMATTMGIVTVVSSIFYPVVSESLGVSRASFALTGTITSLSSMVAALFWGNFYAKKPLAKPMVIGVIVFGLAVLGMSFATNIYQFYFLSLLVGLTYGGISIIPVSIMITRHFSKNTGFALSAALAGSGLGAMILNPIINNMISGGNWQPGYRLIAISVFALTLPSAILATRLTKDEVQAKSPEQSQESKLEIQNPQKSTWFWAFLLAAFLTGVTGGAVLSNLPTYLKDLNFAVSHISIITAAYSASLVFGKFVLGGLYDRMGAMIGTITSALLMSLSLGVMVFIQSTPVLILMLICIGIGMAVGTVSVTWLTNYFFGKENYSKYYGSVQFANSFGIAAGVPLIAAALENLAQPSQIWLILTVVSLLMTGLFVFSIRGNRKARAAQITASIGE
ncbi:MAG: MFS transporter [Anaerolineaceae bacterium]|nr:MFS transporter [Anaerolineaceae bacterium]